MTAIEWAGLLPAELAPWAGLLLLAISAVTSFISAAFGLGGGMVLIAVMATIMPATALVPIHGVIQLGSNIGRSVVMLRYISWSRLLPLTLGGVVGAIIGGLIAVRLPDWLLFLAVGSFVLWSAWGKIPVTSGRAALLLGGVASGFLTMFIGGTGPLVAAVLKTLKLERMAHVGTQAGCMVLQHGLKIGVFGLLGFNYAPYLPLVAGMMITGILGTLIGGRVLHGMGDRRFQYALTILLTILGLRLLWQSGSILLQGG
ncbi:MAG: sulfite exporter TauE/SafE family protein [Alphaproteobacteria bacterium]|nr:sulfite exporter TauE/SafE family protein [Alphaproteobacteria bacterium]